MPEAIPSVSSMCPRMWLGASACVPTCGDIVKDVKLTVAPSSSRKVTWRLNGVSPGKHAVLLETGCEMSIIE